MPLNIKYHEILIINNDTDAYYKSVCPERRRKSRA
jgi:hypothetical protein